MFGFSDSTLLSIFSVLICRSICINTSLILSVSPPLRKWYFSCSCPLHQWYHPAISSSVIPFSSCPQSFPASVFSSESVLRIGWPSIGASASASVLPVNIQDWFPLGWTGWIFLQSKGLSRVFSNTQFKSISSSALSFLYGPTRTFIHGCGKIIALTRRTFVSNVMFVLFNMLSRLVITFLPCISVFIIESMK